MQRRRFLSSLLSAPLASASDGSRPNVVILLADDLGWADVGFHNSEIRTPNLDRLASQSLEFERFYSCPLCSPTRSALMTGRDPMRLGTGFTVIRPWADFGISTGERFLPEAFRSAGYQTAMAGKWHLGHSRKAYLPGSRGFDNSYGHVNGAIDYYTHVRDGGLDWHRDGQPLREEGYSTDLISHEAVERIRARDKSKPLFLYVPFNAPHAPLQAPRQLLERYASIQNPQRRAFAAMVDALDSNIGRILDALDSEKISGETIVFFFSDNGGPTGQGARNTPLRGAKGSTWEGGTRVPALLRWPGKVRPGKTKQLSAVVDLFPTLTTAAGVKPRAHAPFDGVDLWPSIQSGSPKRRGPLFFSIESGRGLHFAVHDGPWKLVREIESGGAGKSYLFLIEQDMTEQNDLAAANPAVVRKLNQLIDRWRKSELPGSLRHTGEPPSGFRSPPAWVAAAK
jgi:arylsulfatase A-like enzyme